MEKTVQSFIASLQPDIDATRLRVLHVNDEDSLKQMPEFIKKETTEGAPPSVVFLQLPDVFDNTLVVSLGRVKQLLAFESPSDEDIHKFSRIIMRFLEVLNNKGEQECVVCLKECKNPITTMAICMNCQATTCIPCFSRISRAQGRTQEGKSVFLCPCCRSHVDAESTFDRVSNRPNYQDRRIFWDPFSAIRVAHRCLSKEHPSHPKHMDFLIVDNNNMPMFCRVKVSSTGRVWFTTSCNASYKKIKKLLYTPDVRFIVGKFPYRCRECHEDCSQDPFSSSFGWSFHVDSKKRYVKTHDDDFMGMIACFWAL
jgi:hypothetical protein